MLFFVFDFYVFFWKEKKTKQKNKKLRFIFLSIFFLNNVLILFMQILLKKQIFMVFYKFKNLQMFV
jgi:hypothetical protein